MVIIGIKGRHADGHRRPITKRGRTRNQKLHDKAKERRGA